MKGGANLSDQLAIDRAVQFAVDTGEVLDVVGLAASLQLPVDCCQSFVDFFVTKYGLELPGKKTKAKEEKVGAGFFSKNAKAADEN
jgi:hypothetical protein